jgi:DNA-directed RNA polymerase specialized sigma subunit
MEKGISENMIGSMQTDLTLINNIKESHDEGSLLELINRHSGIYHSMVNNFLSGSQNVKEKNVLAEEKTLNIYSCALTYDPDRNTKFPTYLANQTKWKCLNIINKKKKNKEVYLDDDECFLAEPSCESFVETIKQKEVFQTFSLCLQEEKDERVKKIIDLRYNSNNNKVRAWRIIASEMGMSIQGCINIHNKFIQKVKKQTYNV